MQQERDAALLERLAETAEAAVQSSGGCERQPPPAEATGRQVPEDVAVVGFDDIPAASLTRPPLTTVMQDPRLAGRKLVETLVGRIREEPVGSALLPTKLVVRRSCGSAG